MPFAFNPITGKLDLTVPQFSYDPVYQVLTANAPGDLIQMVSGAPSADLLTILQTFNGLGVSAAGYSSQETCIVFAESQSNVIGGSIFAGVYNPGSDPVAGDALANFVGVGHSVTSILPSAAGMQVRAPANWSSTSTPGEIAFQTMDIGDVDPDFPLDRLVIRSDGSLDFIGQSNSVDGKLSWSDANGVFGSVSRLSLASSGSGEQFAIGSFGAGVQSLLDIFSAVGASSFGCGNEYALGVMESKLDTGLGGAFLLGLDEGTLPFADQVFGSLYMFGNNGAGIAAQPFIECYAGEDWDDGTGAFGFGTRISSALNGTGDLNARIDCRGNGTIVLNSSYISAGDVFILADTGSAIVQSDASLPGIGFFGVTPVVRQTGGAATADLTYSSNERDMLNAVYTALRNYGLLT